MITENEIKELHLLTSFRLARLVKSIWLILFFSQLVYSYIVNSKNCFCKPIDHLAYEIKDLETNDERFKSEIQAWSTSPLLGSDRYTLCGGFYILGGYGVLSGTGQTASGGHYFMRKYYNLPSHTRLYFSFQLWMIDSWDIEDIVEIKLDSKVFNGWIVDTFSLRFILSNQCGASLHNDVGCIKVSGSASHANSSLTFAVISKANQTTYDESLGIRDVVLYFAKTSNLTSDVICGNAGILLNTQQCSCPDGNYQNGGPCFACHNSCASCFGPSANECYRCNEGYSFDGIGCLACDDNCVTCNSTNKCISCKSGDVLWDNSKCIPEGNCSFPLVLFHSNRVCKSHCSNQSYFLFWNGTCADSCPSYYRPRVLESRNFCDLRCPLEKFFYIEENKCLEICPLGFFGSNITKLCQKCTDSLCNVCPAENRCESCFERAILDINDTCRTCNESRITYLRRITQGHQYRLQLLPTSCDLDESTVEMNLEGLASSISNFPAFFFKVTKQKSNIYQVDLILEGSVIEDQNLIVTLFYLNATINVPKKFVSSPLMEEIAQHTGTAQTTVKIFMGVSLGGTLAIGAAAAMWSLLSFQQFVGFFTYLSVEYPPQVKIFLSMSKSIDWNMLPNPLAALTSRWSKDILGSEDPALKKYDAPKKFLDNQIKSFFINNGGSIIVLNFGLLLVLGLVILFRKSEFWKKKRTLKIIKRL